jgi:formylmethanofuran dehydrogenase subunit E
LKLSCSNDSDLVVRFRHDPKDEKESFQVKQRESFQKLLDKATAFHGHLCSGQVLGVRVAMLGLDELGITDPFGADWKKLVVFVEVSRCFADAIMTVTGCRVGKRSFKIMDTGKFAATFLNMETGSAVRIALRSDIWDRIAVSFPGRDARKAEKTAYLEMTDGELFVLQDVAVAMNKEDTPGVPIVRAFCCSCGDAVMDRREVIREGRVLCRSCAAGDSYFTAQSPVRTPERKEVHP